MNRICSLVAFLTTALILSCSSPAAPAPQPAPVRTSPEVVEELDIPDWAVNIPKEPGQAFFGVGAAALKSVTQVDLAKQSAATGARRQIADTMRTTIQGCTKRYARQVLTATGEVVEEGLTQDVTRAVTNFALSGASIEQFYISKKADPKTGLRMVWALARIGFDSVAENLHDEAAKRIEQVRKNSDEAFKELDRLLKDEQEREAAGAGGQ